MALVKDLLKIPAACQQARDQSEILKTKKINPDQIAHIKGVIFMDTTEINQLLKEGYHLLHEECGDNSDGLGVPMVLYFVQLQK